MDKNEVIERMTYEVAMGFSWGDPRSLIEQSQENKEKWDRLVEQTQIAKTRKWIVEIPDDLPDISDYRPGNI